MSSIRIRNARIIDSGAEIDKVGDLFVRDGFIVTADGYTESTDCLELDAEGLIAAPGLVDMHVHTRDPGFTHKDDILSVAQSAAAGGVTALAAMPNTKPATDTVETIQYIVNKAKKAPVRIFPVAAVSIGLEGKEQTDCSALKEAGAVAFSDDGEPVSSAQLMSEAMKAASWLGVPLLAHCEDKSLAGEGIMNFGVVSEMLGVPGIPVSSEVVGVAREIALAKALDVPVHICHVSSAEAVDFIRMAKRNGIKVTAETCPHYFSLNEELLMHQDADYRMNPPLRAEQDRRAILRGIIDGTIDVIATDHAPHTVEEKSNFMQAPNGVVGLETSLAAGVTNLVNKGYISMFKLIYMMSTVPAQILGIDAGSLQPGARADIVLFDPDQRWIVDVKTLHSNSKNSAFKGLELCGKVKYTICGGDLVYTNQNGE